MRFELANKKGKAVGFEIEPDPNVEAEKIFYGELPMLESCSATRNSRTNRLA